MQPALPREHFSNYAWRRRWYTIGRASRHPFWLIVGASLWMASVGNAALWRELAQLGLLQGMRGALFGIAVGALLVALLCALLGLFAWRTTLKPVLVTLLIGSAFGAHFMLAYHVVLDTAMLTNVLQTNPREAHDLLSMRLLATVLVLGVLPAAWVWRTSLRPLAWPKRIVQNAAFVLASLGVAMAVLLLSFQPLSSAMRNHRHVRHLATPLNIVQALAQVLAQPLRRNESILMPIGEDARLGPTHATSARPPLVVLVIGETGRAGNFGLNGYERATTPELAAENVASFRNAWSCGTSTAASVPCMFSHLGRSAFEARDHNFEGLLDVLQRAGLAVLWVDNQSGCKGVCARVPTVSTAATGDPALCSGGECFDEVMLLGLDERITALPAEQRARGVVVVMHPMGSHGPAYSRRSPPAFKPFLPECTSNLLQDCSREQLLNAYDNSIAYTDHVLGATIRWLKAHDAASDTAMVYLADHGESLGENNLFLHGLPYAVAPDVQKRVPWITWLSPAFERRSGISIACLAQQRDRPVSHDHWFHSVLGLLDVETAVYRRTADVYAPCAAR
jgi:lipid A ethanolaminephosphotransferase